MKHPGPFRSQLVPYVDQIRAWRRAGKTWKEVTEGLAKLGIKTDPGTACRFMKRVRDKPYPIGAEPDPVPTRPVQPTGSRQTRRAPKAARSQPAANQPMPEDPDLNPYEHLEEAKIHIPLLQPKPRKHDRPS
jgi:hypothetical protein